MACLRHIGRCRKVLCRKGQHRTCDRRTYEIQFDPKDKRSGTKGLKILSYAPEEMLSFQWNAPPEFPDVRNGGTWVVVEMRPIDAYMTHVTVTHLGWTVAADRIVSEALATRQERSVRLQADSFNADDQGD
jgi:uncharacterized protein YndB with AHSA1/START domain